MSEPVIAIGKCHKCKRVERGSISPRTTPRASSEPSHTFAAKDPAWETVIGNGMWGPWRIKCPNDHLMFVHKINGRRNSTPCDRRCTNATGHDCECSCAGKNHGANA